MQITGRSAHRIAITFRSVNLPGSDSYDPGLQRHHLLPQQLLSHRCFGAMFGAIGLGAVGFDDFRRNGLLQGALRRQLLAGRRRVLLNRNDPLGTGFDFTELDAMAERLWSAQ